MSFGVIYYLKNIYNLEESALCLLLSYIVWHTTNVTTFSQNHEFPPPKPDGFAPPSRSEMFVCCYQVFRPWCPASSLVTRAWWGCSSSKTLLCSTHRELELEDKCKVSWCSIRRCHPIRYFWRHWKTAAIGNAFKYVLSAKTKSSSSKPTKACFCLYGRLVQVPVANENQQVVQQQYQQQVMVPVSQSVQGPVPVFYSVITPTQQNSTRYESTSVDFCWPEQILRCGHCPLLSKKWISPIQKNDSLSNRAVIV